MKKKRSILNLAAILLLVAGVVACKKEKEEVFPQEIPFTEYSLAGGDCQRNFFEPYYVDGESLIKVGVINGRNEMGIYVICSDTNYPEIDFTEHTLLFIYGDVPQNASSISIKLFKYSMTEYELKVTAMNNTMVVEKCDTFIVVPKIPVGAKINVTIDNVQL